MEITYTSAKNILQVNSILVLRELLEKRSIRVPGIGTIYIIKRPAHRNYNAVTGVEEILAARDVVKFRASPAMKNLVKKMENETSKSTKG